MNNTASIVLELSDAELNVLLTKAQVGDATAMADAMAALDPLLIRLCRPLREWASRHMDFEDLLQEARCEATQLVKRYRPAEGTPPGAFMSVCVKRLLWFRLGQAGRQLHLASSLDTPSGEDGRQLSEFNDPALIVDGVDVVDTAMEELLSRLPVGAIGAGEQRLRDVLQAHGLQKHLPDDDTLVALVKAGKTRDDLAAMFGVTYNAVGDRLTQIRKSGITVPMVRAQGSAPWEENRRRVADYLRENPGASTNQTAKALQTTWAAVDKARKALA